MHLADHVFLSCQCRVIVFIHNNAKLFRMCTSVVNLSRPVLHTSITMYLNDHGVSAKGTRKTTLAPFKRLLDLF